MSLGIKYLSLFYPMFNFVDSSRSCVGIFIQYLDILFHRRMPALFSAA